MNPRELQKLKQPLNYMKPNTLYEQLLQGTNSKSLVQHNQPKLCQPLKLLDAPNVVPNNNYHILHWSQGDVIALALENNLFLRNFSTGTTQLVNTLQQNLFTSVYLIEEILISASSDSVLEIMNCEKKQLLQSHQYKGTIFQIQYLNNMLCCATDKMGILLFDLRQRNYGFQIGQDSHISLDVNQNNIIVAGARDSVEIWDLRNPKFKLLQVPYPGESVCWSQGKHNYVLSGGQEGVVEWRGEDGKKSLHLNQKVQSVLALNQSIIYSSDDCIMIDKNYILKRHQDKVLNIILSPDKNQLCSLGSDELLIFWNLMDL